MLANILIDYFLKGGPIMYPILVVAIVAVCVVGDSEVADALNRKALSLPSSVGLAVSDQERVLDVLLQEY